jgi:ferric-dicitrate binding protein FerR (iron transport regulator)
MNENLISDSLYEAMVAYYENNLTQVQAEELLSWIDEAEENLQYFTETGKIWYASGLLKKEEKETGEPWKRLLEKIEDNDIRPVPGPSISIPLKPLVRIAAAAVIILALSITGLFFFRSHKMNSIANLYEIIAPKGSRSVITLADGSKVWLNSGTVLQYNSEFGKRTREVYLEGEAYFSVSENKDLPFRVRTNDIYITALGTAFNVKAYNDENIIETTLEKGNVLIEHIKTSESDIYQAPVSLKPNQKAIFIRSSGDLSVNDTKPAIITAEKNPKVKVTPVLIKVDSLIDTHLSTSWKDNKWIFKSKKLKELAPILERRYDITISFIDTSLYNYKFTGTLKEESLEQVLKALTLAAPIQFNVNHNKVFLYEDPNQRNRYTRQIKQQIK